MSGKKQSLDPTQQNGDYDCEMLQEIAANFPHYFAVIDPATYEIIQSNTLLKTSDGQDRMKCYEVSHQSGQPCSGDLHPCPLLDVKETGKIARSVHEHISECGEIEIVQVIGVPIFDSGSKLKYVIEYCMNITDLVEAQRDADIQLQRQHREIELYTSLLRHDLGNDLGGIVSSLEIVKMVMDEDSAEAIEFLNAALAISTRMDNLLRSIRSTPIVEDEDIGKYLRRIAKLSEDAMVGLKIHVQIDENLSGVLVRGSRLLPMVFENLFRNAVQHAGETPIVTVQATPMEESVQILVWDNGPGVPDAVRDQLFARGASTKTSGGGLGLYLSRRIIEACDGSIVLTESEEGKGAQFRVMLPII